jgi:hypothetical protein
MHPRKTPIEIRASPFAEETTCGDAHGQFPGRVIEDRAERVVASVLAHRCDWDDSTIVAVHELAGEAATVALALDGPDDTDALVDLLLGAEPRTIRARRR